MIQGTNRLSGRQNNVLDLNEDGSIEASSGLSAIVVNGTKPTVVPSFTPPVNLVIPNINLTSSSLETATDIVPTRPTGSRVTSSAIYLNTDFTGSIDLQFQFLELPDDEEEGVGLFSDTSGIELLNVFNSKDIEEASFTNAANIRNASSTTKEIKWSDLNVARQSKAKKFYKIATTQFGYTDIEAKAIISVIAKENAFDIKGAENLNYSADGIKTVFGDRIREIQTGSRKGQKVKISEWTLDELNWMAKKPIRIANFIYGQDGNIIGGKFVPSNERIVPISEVDNANAEGNRFRGRSYGSITYKATYRSYQNKYNKNYPTDKIDIVNKPELLDDENFAYKFVAFQYKNPPSSWSPSSGGYNLNVPKDAVSYYVRLFGGWGSFTDKYTPKVPRKGRPIVKEGLEKALSFYESIKNLNLN